MLKAKEKLSCHFEVGFAFIAFVGFKVENYILE
jgi:hypothetical protein